MKFHLTRLAFAFVQFFYLLNLSNPKEIRTASPLHRSAGEQHGSRSTRDVLSNFERHPRYDYHHSHLKPVDNSLSSVHRQLVHRDPAAYGHHKPSAQLVRKPYPQHSSYQQSGHYRPASASHASYKPSSAQLVHKPSPAYPQKPYKPSGHYGHKPTVQLVHKPNYHKSSVDRPSYSANHQPVPYDYKTSAPHYRPAPQTHHYTYPMQAHSYKKPDVSYGRPAHHSYSSSHHPSHGYGHTSYQQVKPNPTYSKHYEKHQPVKAHGNKHSNAYHEAKVQPIAPYYYHVTYYDIVPKSPLKPDIGKLLKEIKEDKKEKINPNKGFQVPDIKHDYEVPLIPKIIYDHNYRKGKKLRKEKLEKDGSFEESEEVLALHEDDSEERYVESSEDSTEDSSEESTKEHSKEESNEVHSEESSSEAGHKEDDVKNDGAEENPNEKHDEDEGDEEKKAEVDEEKKGEVDEEKKGEVDEEKEESVEDKKEGEPKNDEKKKEEPVIIDDVSGTDHSNKNQDSLKVQDVLPIKSELTGDRKEDKPIEGVLKPMEKGDTLEKSSPWMKPDVGNKEALTAGDKISVKVETNKPSVNDGTVDKLQNGLKEEKNDGPRVNDGSSRTSFVDTSKVPKKETVNPSEAAKVKTGGKETGAKADPVGTPNVVQGKAMDDTTGQSESEKKPNTDDKAELNANEKIPVQVDTSESNKNDDKVDKPKNKPEKNDGPSVNGGSSRTSSDDTSKLPKKETVPPSEAAKVKTGDEGTGGTTPDKTDGTRKGSKGNDKDAVIDKSESRNKPNTVGKAELNLNERIPVLVDQHQSAREKEKNDGPRVNDGSSRTNADDTSQGSKMKTVPPSKAAELKDDGKGTGGITPAKADPVGTPNVVQGKAKDDTTGQSESEKKLNTDEKAELNSNKKIPVRVDTSKPKENDNKVDKLLNGREKEKNGGPSVNGGSSRTSSDDTSKLPKKETVPPSEAAKVKTGDEGTGETELAETEPADMVKDSEGKAKDVTIDKIGSRNKPNTVGKAELNSNERNPVLVDTTGPKGNGDNVNVPQNGQQDKNHVPNVNDGSSKKSSLDSSQTSKVKTVHPSETAKVKTGDKGTSGITPDKTDPDGTLKVSKGKDRDTTIDKIGSRNKPNTVGKAESNSNERIPVLVDTTGAKGNGDNVKVPQNGPKDKNPFPNVNDGSSRTSSLDNSQVPKTKTALPTEVAKAKIGGKGTTAAKPAKPDPVGTLKGSKGKDKDATIDESESGNKPDTVSKAELAENDKSPIWVDTSGPKGNGDKVNAPQNGPKKDKNPNVSNDGSRTSSADMVEVPKTKTVHPSETAKVTVGVERPGGTALAEKDQDAPNVFEGKAEDGTIGKSGSSVDPITVSEAEKTSAKVDTSKINQNEGKVEEPKDGSKKEKNDAPSLNDVSSGTSAVGASEAPEEIAPSTEVANLKSGDKGTSGIVLALKDADGTPKASKEKAKDGTASKSESRSKPDTVSKAQLGENDKSLARVDTSNIPSINDSKAEKTEKGLKKEQAVGPSVNDGSGRTSFLSASEVPKTETVPPIEAASVKVGDEGTSGTALAEKNPDGTLKVPKGKDKDAKIDKSESRSEAELGTNDKSPARVDTSKPNINDGSGRTNVVSASEDPKTGTIPPIEAASVKVGDEGTGGIALAEKDPAGTPNVSEGKAEDGSSGKSRSRVDPSTVKKSEKTAAKVDTSKINQNEGKVEEPKNGSKKEINDGPSLNDGSSLSSAVGGSEAPEETAPPTEVANLKTGDKGTSGIVLALKDADGTPKASKEKAKDGTAAKSESRTKPSEAKLNEKITVLVGTNKPNVDDGTVDSPQNSPKKDKNDGPSVGDDGSEASSLDKSQVPKTNIVPPTSVGEVKTGGKGTTATKTEPADTVKDSEGKAKDVTIEKGESQKNPNTSSQAAFNSNERTHVLVDEHQSGIDKDKNDGPRVNGGTSGTSSDDTSQGSKMKTVPPSKDAELKDDGKGTGRITPAKADPVGTPNVVQGKAEDDTTGQSDSEKKPNTDDKEELNANEKIPVLVNTSEPNDDKVDKPQNGPKQDKNDGPSVGDNGSEASSLDKSQVPKTKTALPTEVAKAKTGGKGSATKPAKTEPANMLKGSNGKDKDPTIDKSESRSKLDTVSKAQLGENDKSLARADISNIPSINDSKAEKTEKGLKKEQAVGPSVNDDSGRTSFVSASKVPKTETNPSIEAATVKVGAEGTSGTALAQADAVGTSTVSVEKDVPTGKSESSSMPNSDSTVVSSVDTKQDTIGQTEKGDQVNNS